MTRIGKITIVCLLATSCFAQEQVKYRNSDHHFSFRLPKGWEAISADDLSDEENEAVEERFKDTKLMVLCQKMGDEHFTTPFILVTFLNTEKWSEKFYEMLWQSESGRESLRKSEEKFINDLQKPEGFHPKSWEGAEKVAARVDYNVNYHAYFSILELYNENVGEIFGAAVKLLGSHRVVFFRFYVDGLSKEDFSALLDQVIDSFRYDKGYGFGEGRGMVDAFTKAHLRKYMLHSILAFVGISIFVMILRRWVTG